MEQCGRPGGSGVWRCGQGEGQKPATFCVRSLWIVPCYNRTLFSKLIFVNISWKFQKIISFADVRFYWRTPSPRTRRVLLNYFLNQNFESTAVDPEVHQVQWTKFLVESWVPTPVFRPKDIQKVQITFFWTTLMLFELYHSLWSTYIQSWESLN